MGGRSIVQQKANYAPSVLYLGVGGGRAHLPGDRKCGLAGIGHDKDAVARPPHRHKGARAPNEMSPVSPEKKHRVMAIVIHGG